MKQKLVSIESEKIEAAKGIIASIYASQRTLRVLAPDYKWAGLGNLLGDFGELVAIHHYQLKKAPTGSKDFDAFTIDGKKVQIKANHAANQIGVRGEPDLILIIHVDDNGDWNQVYYGDYETVKKYSKYGKRDNSWKISIKKLRSLQEEKGNRKLDRYVGSLNNLGYV